MNTRQGSSRLQQAAAVLLVCSGAVACGGGGGGGGDAPAASTRVTGSAFAAPVAGGAVTVRDGSGAVIAGPAATTASGGYGLDVPTAALAAELYFELSGGSYTDEATAQLTQLAGTDRLGAVAAAGSLGPGGAVHLSPATTVVHHLVEDHGLSRAEARVRFRDAFGFTPDPSIAPANSGAAAAASRLAGLRAAGFSQLTADLALAPGDQFALLEALARDLAAGSPDGADTGGPVAVGATGEALPADIQNCYENALMGFFESPANLTGLGPDQLGFLAFAKVALTPSYRVEYVPVPPGAAVGRTPFRLSITHRDGGAPVAGLTVSVVPLMGMANGYQHSTPWEPLVEVLDDRGEVAYDGAIYYSMPGGEGFGHWSLAVRIAAGSTAETATFHPVVSGLNVNMALLRGQDDQIQGASGAEARPYYLFDAGLTPLAGGGYRFDLFVAAREDDQNYPGLAPGLALHDEQAAAWSVADAVVEVALDTDGDEAPDTWHSAGSAGGGLWSIPGLPGIDPLSETLIFYVRLSVNGEQKTADGQAPDGTNDYARMEMGGASCCE